MIQQYSPSISSRLNHLDPFGSFWVFQAVSLDKDIDGHVTFHCIFVLTKYTNL